MQSKVQPVNDSKSRTKTNLFEDWRPNFLRLVLGVMFAAGLSYVVLKTLHPVFVVPKDIGDVPEASPLWLYERHDKAKFEVDGKNFSIVFGVIGAIFGASCVVFSFGTRSVYAIVVAVVGSAALGVLGANLSNWMFNNLRETSGKDLVIMGITLDSMGQTIVGYASLWCLIGLGVGLGFGSARGIGKSLVGGISGFCGGFLGALIYVFLTAQFSVSASMNRVFPLDNMSLAVWLVLFTVVIAVCIALGSGEKRRAKKA